MGNERKCEKLNEAPNPSSWLSPSSQILESCQWTYEQCTSFVTTNVGRSRAPTAAPKRNCSGILANQGDTQIIIVGEAESLESPFREDLGSEIVKPGARVSWIQTLQLESPTSTTDQQSTHTSSSFLSSLAHHKPHCPLSHPQTTSHSPFLLSHHLHSPPPFGIEYSFVPSRRPPLTLSISHHPRIHLPLILCHHRSCIQPRIPTRSTQHSSQVPSPVAMWEWVRRWRARDECFVRLIADLLIWIG